MSRTVRTALVTLIALSFVLSAAVVLSIAPALRIAGPAAAAITRAWFGLARDAAAAPAHHLLPGLPDASLCSSGASSWYADEDGDLEWAVVDPAGGPSVFNNTRESMRALNGELAHASQPLLWFAQGPAEWVVRDLGTVRRAQAIVAPAREIGRQMGEVGRQLGDVGRELARLHAEREARMESGRRAELSARMRELSAKQREAMREARARIRELIEEAKRAGRAERYGDSI